MILLLDHYDSFTYNIVQGLAICNQQVRVCPDTYDAVAQLDDTITHIVLSPGAGKPEQTRSGYRILEQAINRHIPVLGICLGHQIIASYFGAKVVQMPVPAHAQECRILHDAKGVFTGIASPMTVGQYHSLCVQPESLPTCLTVTAYTQQALVMAIQHITYPIYGVQFHPESVFSPEGQKLLENFITLC